MHLVRIAVWAGGVWIAFNSVGIAFIGILLTRRELETAKLRRQERRAQQLTPDGYADAYADASVTCIDPRW